MVKLNGKAGFILGIDIGRLFTNFIILDLERNVLADVGKKSIPLSNDISLIEQLDKEIKNLILETNISWNKLLGIGVSIPGMVKGKIGQSEIYFNFGNKTAKEMLEERFKKPVHIEHDLQAMALGELWFGEAQNEKNVLCVNVGWGLGLGIILDGKVYYGEDGYAGEFGHIQVVSEGELCYCGKKDVSKQYLPVEQLRKSLVKKSRKGLQR